VDDNGNPVNNTGASSATSSVDKFGKMQPTIRTQFRPGQ
jgi:hypothetical protein